MQSGVFSVLGAMIGGLAITIAFGLFSGEYTMGWLAQGLIVGLILSFVEWRLPVEQFLAKLRPGSPAKQPPGTKRKILSDIGWSSIVVLLLTIFMLEFMSVQPPAWTLQLFENVTLVAIIGGAIFGAASWLFVFIFGEDTPPSTRRH